MRASRPCPGRRVSCAIQRSNGRRPGCGGRSMQLARTGCFVAAAKVACISRRFGTTNSLVSL
eukprot:6163701-Lingulodinium_polyedra.AAC.1